MWGVERKDCSAVFLGFFHDPQAGTNYHLMVVVLGLRQLGFQNQGQQGAGFKGCGLLMLVCFVLKFWEAGRSNFYFDFMTNNSAACEFGRNACNSVAFFIRMANAHWILLYGI